MNNKISIRKATISDVQQFASVKATAYADDRLKSKPLEANTPEWYNGVWYVGLGILNESEAIRIIDKYDSYIIMLDNTEIGSFWIHCESPNSLSLEDFCILPVYQGHGYGTQTLYLIEALYKENKVWKLSTPCFCIRNRHLYKKVGYQEVGRCSNDTVILYEKHMN